LPQTPERNFNTTEWEAKDEIFYLVLCGGDKKRLVFFISPPHISFIDEENSHSFPYDHGMTLVLRPFPHMDGGPQIDG
jgi:hypothetical protein